MFRKSLFVALAAATLAAGAAQAEDLVRSVPIAESLRAGRVAALAAERAKADAAPAAVTTAEVGDAESFGRNVKYVGLVSAFAQMLDTCTPAAGEPAPMNCVSLAPAPAMTSFVMNDLASITLPGRSSQSLLCHWQTPVVQWGASNFGTTAQTVMLRAIPTYRIESDVLDGLTNPNTGLPFNGFIDMSLTGVGFTKTLQPGEYEQDIITGARVCIGALVSHRALVDQYGLTPAQARKFFRRPITIRMGLRGNARGIEYASINYGTRFVGD